MTERKNLGWAGNLHAHQFKCMNCSNIFSEETRYHSSMGGDFCSEKCYDEYAKDFDEDNP